MTSRASRRLEDFGGLPACTWLCRGAPVVMTSNVCQPWNLYNGAVGRVVDILFLPGEEPTMDGSSWPHVILVDFPQYTGPLFVRGYPTVVPVFPIEVSERKKGASRRMFPIRLGFCLTCHKAQGFTCGPGHMYERVVFNMGPANTENWGAGLGFVGSSRCTCADYLAFDGNLTGTRVERITKGKTVEKVRQEDQRLHRLHAQTVRQFAGEDYEELVDWALSYISHHRQSSQHVTQPSGDRDESVGVRESLSGDRDSAGRESPRQGPDNVPQNDTCHDQFPDEDSHSEYSSTYNSDDSFDEGVDEFIDADNL